MARENILATSVGKETTVGRPAKASLGDIARTCAKLEAEGTLTVHTLRQALGGGGSDMLVRELRQWRQRQREEARAPLEGIISQGLHAAWSHELRRTREEAASEVHAMYADDKAHLDFCMFEMQRLEKKVDELEEALMASGSAAERANNQAAVAIKAATDRAAENEQCAGDLKRRLEDLQRVDNEKTAALEVARQQRDRDIQELSQERVAHASVQQAHQKLLNAQTAQASELARLEERCLQQQETLRYMRADVEAKTRDVETLRMLITGLEAELRDKVESVVRAEAALESQRQILKARYHLKNSIPLTSRTSITTHKS